MSATATAAPGDEKNPADRTLRDEVITIVRANSNAKPDGLTDETLIRSIVLDSLDTQELVMELEDVFEIEIPDRDAQQLQTVGDVIKLVAHRVGCRPETSIIHVFGRHG